MYIIQRRERKQYFATLVAVVTPSVPATQRRPHIFPAQLPPPCLRHRCESTVSSPNYRPIETLNPYDPSTCLAWFVHSPDIASIARSTLRIAFAGRSTGSRNEDGGESMAARLYPYHRSPFPHPTLICKHCQLC